MKILLFRGRGILSALIRWQTGSQYSHAGALVDDTWLYEAWQGAGVRVKRFDWSDIDNIDFFEIAGLTPEKEARMLEYLNSRVGNKYDYWGVLRFITRSRPKRNNADFCSEYVYSAAEHADISLLARTEPAEVSPGLLARSPLLLQVPSRPIRPISPITPIPANSMNTQQKGTPMKTNLIHRLSSIVHPLVRKACGNRVIRLHPKFRWLSYACAIINRSEHVAPVSNRQVRRLSACIGKTVNPPDGPPRLRLRKRRLSVRRSM